MDAIERLRSLVRTVVRQVARGLNVASHGNVTPNMVTIAGLLLHIVIIWLILTDYWLLAALSLIIFGLFDTLDGELARLQQRTSDFGMILDATTDRIKEGMLLGAIAYWFATQHEPWLVALSLSALVLSFTVSYIKAKAETVVAAAIGDPSKTNRRYQEGLGRFEVRMTLIVLGLATGRVTIILWLLALLSLWTVIDRAVRINADLTHGTH
jgi:CDP-diacylglycerol--glycerol-3-phosphate 3-phosphatidyltransferase